MNDVIKNVTDVGATTKRTNYSDFFRSFLVVVALLFGSCVVLACVILRQREVNTYTRVQNSILNDTVYSTVTRGNTLFEAPKNGVDINMLSLNPKIKVTPYKKGWLFPKFGYYLSSENPYIPLNDTIPPR